MYASQLGSSEANSAWRNGNELCRQLKLNKQYPQIEGAVFFSAKPFLKNKQNLNDSLQLNYYKYPAICPVNHNIEGETPAQPQNIKILRDGKDAYLIWDDINGEGGCSTAYYVIYAFKGRKVGDMDDPANIAHRTTENCVDLRILDEKFHGTYTFVVTAVNKFKHESVPTYGVTRRL